VEILASRVLLRPSDLDASLAFYEGALGLHRFRQWGERPHRGVVLFLGGGYLELTERPPDDPGDVEVAGVRLWLQVRDVDDAAAELALAGVPVAAPPERKPWGLVEATGLDPDGLPLVLVEVPTDHPLRRDTR
jgi:catechol 2,3-dioxygenase-like lactoylglutathione lyase family enzyme